jgi:hypothetical protein
LTIEPEVSRYLIASKAHDYAPTGIFVRPEGCLHQVAGRLISLRSTAGGAERRIAVAYRR